MLAVVLLVTFVALVALLSRDPDLNLGWIIWYAGTAAFVVSFAWTKVTIDDDRIRIAIGPGGIIRIKSIPLSEVTAVLPIEVRPMANYGGWGLRYGGQPGRRGWAVVIRGGDALLIERRNKKQFVVTVDDPEAAVTALKALV
jgi:hypothetical protein